MTTTLSPIHIALLDDHRLFRQGIAFILHRLPYEVSIVEAATLAELLPQLATRLPDVLLLDLQLPDVDGLEATKRLLEQYPDLRIVVLSMHTDELMVAHMMKLGVRSYLPKDVDKELLQDAVAPDAKIEARARVCAAVRSGEYGAKELTIRANGLDIAAVLSEGYYFTDIISKALVRGLHAPAKSQPSLGTPVPTLTPREKEVLKQICQGKTTGEIAKHLFISHRTVEGHRQNLLEKTNTTNAASLVLYAVRHRLVPTDVRQ